MPKRRTLLGAAGGLVGTALVGFGAARTTETDDADDGAAEPAEAAVEYARNVEEVRGHLVSATTLLERGRRADAAFHAGHGGDYFAAVLPPVRDEDPELATRLRARLNEVPKRVESDDAGAFDAFVTGEVYPLLDEAVGLVVDGETRESTAFDVRVMNALAGRIAEEYDAAVTADGTVQEEGEYWDGRGFLVRIEERHDGISAAVDGAGGDSLDRLRSEMEARDPPSAVAGTIRRFRVRTAAAADLPSATVEDREDALTYVRSAEEVRGHLRSSVALADVGSRDAGLHAGHGSDYLLTLLPPVRRTDPDLSERLLDRMAAVDDRAASATAAEYERYVAEDVLPLVEEAVSVAVPAEYADSTPFDAAVFLALADRVADEYDAAVTDGEAIELYDEYWDARGFLARMEARFEAMVSDLDGETRSAVDEELGVLREELETARPPWDVENSVAALHRLLDDVAAA
ncbi:hypothetical protein BRD02_08835 [Halobacteriales archaeon QS_8_69_73]|nr:MAG: hypothetical protein BRD02_08835 [Halobacteriales archaeon QS_8_69_73]